MTELVERALAAVKALPIETQDEIARLVLSIAGDDAAPVELTPEEEAALERSRGCSGPRRLCVGRTDQSDLGEAWSVKLRFTSPAAEELDDILDYIAAASPSGARHVQQRLKAVLELLLEHPGAGRKTRRRNMRRIVTASLRFSIGAVASHAA